MISYDKNFPYRPSIYMYQISRRFPYRPYPSTKFPFVSCTFPFPLLKFPSFNVPSISYYKISRRFQYRRSRTIFPMATLLLGILKHFLPETNVEWYFPELFSYVSTRRFEDFDQLPSLAMFCVGKATEWSVWKTSFLEPIILSLSTHKI
jgi:hypothetical protein